MASFWIRHLNSPDKDCDQRLLVTFVFQLSQRLPARINRRLALTWFIIEIRAALRAQTPASFAAPHAQRQRQFKLLQHERVQVELIVFINRKIKIAVLQLGLAAFAGFVFAGRIIKIEGRGNRNDDRFKTAVAGQFEDGFKLSLHVQVNPGTTDPARNERRLAQQKFVPAQVRLASLILMLEPEAFICQTCQ